MTDTSATTLLEREELLALLDAATHLNRMRTLEEVLDHILDLACRLADSEAGSVLLFDPDREDLYFAAANGPVAEELHDVRVPVEGSFAGKVFSKGEPEVENHLTEYYESVDRETEFSTKAMICVPLVHRGEAKGVMQIINKSGGRKPYGKRDLELMTRFADQAALSIRNAELYEQMLGSSGLFAQPAVRADYLPLLTGEEQHRAVAEKLTLLVADMRGFSKLCQSKSPTEIKRCLDEFFRVLTEQVIAHSGIVNKLMGDGMIAIFRGADQLVDAVGTAFSIIEEFGVLRTQWDEETRENLDYLDVGVGLATDDEDKIIVGRIGRSKCFDFTVIGRAVNFASALANQARRGKRILCDQLVYRELGEARDLSWVDVEKLEPFRMKHIEDDFDRYHLFAGARHDIFMSYRRDGGSEIAQALREALKGEYDIFLDVESLRAGPFEPALMNRISTAPHFIVLLNERALDACAQPDDWLRREIAHAIRTRRNVVPVLLPRFTFPESDALPDEISKIASYHSVTYRHDDFGGTVNRLLEFLQ